MKKKLVIMALVCMSVLAVGCRKKAGDAKNENADAVGFEQEAVKQDSIGNDEEAAGLLKTALENFKNADKHKFDIDLVVDSEYISESDPGANGLSVHLVSTTNFEDTKDFAHTNLHMSAVLFGNESEEFDESYFDYATKTQYINSTVNGDEYGWQYSEYSDIDDPAEMINMLPTMDELDEIQFANDEKTVITAVSTALYEEVMSVERDDPKMNLEFTVEDGMLKRVDMEIPMITDKTEGSHDSYSTIYTIYDASGVDVKIPEDVIKNAVLYEAPDDEFAFDDVEADETEMDEEEAADETVEDAGDEAVEDAGEEAADQD